MKRKPGNKTGLKRSPIAKKTESGNKMVLICSPILVYCFRRLARKSIAGPDLSPDYFVAI